MRDRTPPRNSGGNSQDRSSRSTAATATIVGAVITAIAAIIAAIISALGNPFDDGPSRIKVSLSETRHNGAPIAPGEDLSFTGSAEGVPEGHSLWLVSRTPDPGSPYYIAQGKPLEIGNNTWTADVKRLGAPTDLGKTRVFLIVDADEACSKQLTAASRNTPRRLNSLLSSCNPLEPEVAIRFKPSPESS